MSDFSDAMSNAVRVLARKHAIATEQLTEDQLVSAIEQAIACGDFQRYVLLQGQQVVYIPFAKEARLQAEIADLKTVLAYYEREAPHLNPFENSDEQP